VISIGGMVPADAGRRRPQARASGRGGLSLVEVLVVIAIIAGITGLVLPGMQSAREAGRRCQCLDHLRQIGLGFRHYEQARGFFPTSVSGSGARHYWAAQILPFVEESTVAGIYDYTVACSDVRNRSAVLLPLPLLVCPSTPPPARQDVKFIKTGTTWPAAAADYAGSAGPDSTLWTAPAVVSWPQPASSDGFFTGTIKPGQRGRRVSDFTDGTSKSVALVECAGRPQVWAFGGVSPDSGLATSPTGKYVSLCGWADANLFKVKGFKQDVTQTDPCNQAKSPGPQLVNATNAMGIYACHPGGAGLLMADGAAQFVEATVSADVVVAQLTIRAGDVVAAP